MVLLSCRLSNKQGNMLSDYLVILELLEVVQLELWGSKISVIGLLAGRRPCSSFPQS